MDFHGKVALITGAGSGIGAATALGYARRGGHVALADIDVLAAQAVADGITEGGGQALVLEVDLAKPEQVRDMVTAAYAGFGRIDFLHNNGFGLPAKLMDRRIASIDAIDEEIWHHSLAVGLTAVLLATKHVIPLMQAQGGGAIVNTASVAGLGGDIGSASYNTVKAGLINLTRVTALEQARKNIRANVVCPGFVDTAMLQRGLAARGLKNSIFNAVPLKRPATVDEIANVVLFLASDLSAYLTGAVIPVDGGLSAGSGLPARPR